MKSRNSQISGFENLNSSGNNIFSSIDSEKKSLIFDEMETGLSNFLHYQKFPGFKWPAWIDDAGNDSSANYRGAAIPLLLNNSLRQWQSFTNFFSGNQVFVNSTGMISGPGGGAWSVEFWVLHKGKVYNLNDNPLKIRGAVDSRSGILHFAGDFGDFSFKETLFGARSNIDESIVKLSLDFKKSVSDSFFFAVIRPYNNTVLGNLKSIRFDPADLAVSINDRKHLSMSQKPDLLFSGSGKDGDINVSGQEGAGSVVCSDGMATLALGFRIEGGCFNTWIRFSLDSVGDLLPAKINYDSALEDFRKFAGIRLNNGASLVSPDNKVNIFSRLSRLSLLKGLNSDNDLFTVEYYRKAFFYISALNRAGYEDESGSSLEKLFVNLKFNKKRVEFASVVKGAYLLNSYTDYYLHKRDMEFLQKNFQSIKSIGDYIYSYSSEIHSISQMKTTTLPHVFINRPCGHDLIVIAASMSHMSYLSRCMGIFGDESRFKNEAERLQAILRDDYNNRMDNALPGESDYLGLLALPEKALTGVSSEDYNRFLSFIYNNSNFPVFNRLFGVDNNASAILLNQLLFQNSPLFSDFKEKFFSLTSELFLTPEFINPLTGNGCNGSGRSEMVSFLYFIIIRNMFFIDREDRLELFPVPERSWFKPGAVIQVDQSPSRFGLISFSVETGEKDIKITFNDPPKYLPPDIMINLPFKASIIDGDDFIVKKQTSSSFLINGWPSVVRFNYSNSD